MGSRSKIDKSPRATTPGRYMFKVSKGVVLKPVKPKKITFTDALEDLISGNVKAKAHKTNRNRKRRGKTPKDLPTITKERLKEISALGQEMGAEY